MALSFYPRLKCSTEVSERHVMLIFENPNLICLKSGQNTVMFNRVKFAEIDTDATVLGTLITVFCGDFNSDGYDISYTLIAA